MHVSVQEKKVFMYLHFLGKEMANGMPSVNILFVSYEKYNENYH